MAKRRFNSSKNVVTGDIVRRHPGGFLFETDKAYTELANKIYDIICDLLPTDFTHQETKEISADIAVYCEDVVSDTHVFETFSRIYQRMFHYRLPFYDDNEENDNNGFSLNALRFVVWHSIMAQNLNRLINPMNQGVEMIAEAVFDMLRSDAAELPINDEMADYLYSEDVQTDPIETKKVLMWLMYDCYLGRWELHDSQEESIRQLLNGHGNESMVNYAERSLCTFMSRAWPLSLKPQTIYAEMIRIEMDDDNDDIAKAIEGITFAPIGLYHIMDCDNNYLTVQDYQGKSYKLAMDSFDYNPQGEIKRNLHTDIIASFISMDNETWHVNGICSFTKGTQADFDSYCKNRKNSDELIDRRTHQFDNYLNQHGGKRLFFFKDRGDYIQWLKKELHMKNIDNVDMSPIPGGQPLTAYIETSGNMIICFNTEAIKHPDNKYYDPVEGREYGFNTFIDPDSCSPEFARFLIENNLLPDALINDSHGMERGRQLLQENIEFFARCIRRDIDSDEPFTTRNSVKADLSQTSTDGKLSYMAFVDEVSQLGDFMSKVYKRWHLINASETVITVMDENGKDFSIPTREIYDAHLALNPDEITNNNVELFLSAKKNASPATAILHNVIGKGKSMRQILEALNRLRFNH